jgi:hypothetical protein
VYNDFYDQRAKKKKDFGTGRQIAWRFFFYPMEMGTPNLCTPSDQERA